MISLANNYALIALEYFIITLASYKRNLISKKGSLFISIYLIICTLVGFIFQEEFVGILLFIHFFLQFAFCYSHVRNFITPTIMIMVEQSLICILWLPLYFIYFNSKQPILFYLLQAQTNRFYLFALFQLFLLCLLLYLIYILDKSFSLWYSLTLTNRKLFWLSSMLFFSYLFSNFSLFETLMNNELIKARYLTYIIILLTLTTSITIYFINMSYKRQIEFDLLSSSFLQNKEQFQYAREFKHDYRNLMSSFRFYLEDNDVKSAKELLDQFDDYSQILFEDDTYQLISLIGHPALQGVFLKFVNECRARRIKLHLTISNQSPTIDTSLINFLRCLTIILNNAIEAEPDEIFVEITGLDNNGIQIIIQNPYRENIDLTKITQNNYTTKENHTGQGLYIIQRIAKTNSTIGFQLSKSDSFFKVTLSLR